MPELAVWQNFYVIVGSSAGALVGLQFVVITLIAGRPLGAGQEQAGAAFATPTIVHFGFVLMLSATLSAPWRGVEVVAVLLGLLGASGLAYSTIVRRRMRAQTAYRPEFEDWLFHVLLPLAAYAILAFSGAATATRASQAMFGVGAAALLLLFIGIHNAWDAVTYPVFVKRIAGE